MPLLHWLILAPFSFAFTLLAMLLSPLLALFASKDGWLPKWLWWFQTPDNSLDGDGGWKNEHWQWRFSLPSALATYVGRVGWLFRNPAYGLEWGGPLSADLSNYTAIRWYGDTAIQNRPNGKPGYCLTIVETPKATYWHLYYVKTLGTLLGIPRCININLGWGLKTYAEDPSRLKTQPMAMFCFSPRITAYVAAKEN